jgi:hypothetical protein
MLRLLLDVAIRKIKKLFHKYCRYSWFGGYGTQSPKTYYDGQFL